MTSVLFPRGGTAPDVDAPPDCFHDLRLGDIVASGVRRTPRRSRDAPVLSTGAGGVRCRAPPPGVRRPRAQQRPPVVPGQQRIGNRVLNPPRPHCERSEPEKYWPALTRRAGYDDPEPESNSAPATGLLPTPRSRSSVHWMKSAAIQHAPHDASPAPNSSGEPTRSEASA